MRRSRFAAAIALLIGAGCVSPPSLARLDLDGWKTFRSSHIEILGVASETDLRGLGDDLALLLAVAARITNAPMDPPTVPVRVFLLNLGTARSLEFPLGLGGIMSTQVDGYYSMVRDFRLEGPTRQILFHEYTHHLLYKGATLAYPLWYHEGLAEVLSTIRRRENLVEVGAAPAQVTASIRRPKPIDLSRVFAPESYQQLRDPSEFYRAAWATVHYLSANAARGARLERYLQESAQGADWREAYARSFDLPLSELSHQVDEHAGLFARGVPYRLAAFDARSLPAVPRGELHDLAPAEAAYQLGELLLRFVDERRNASTRQLALAQALFLRALAIDADHARARAGLALCRALAGDPAGARVDAEGALELAPDDARVHVMSGRVELARMRAAGKDPASGEAREAARAQFNRALELSPSDPAAWARLGESYVGAEEDLGAGIAALERAREIGAWDPSVNLDLGRLYAASGDRDRARDRFLEVARISMGSAAEEAEELLADLPHPAAEQDDAR